MFLKELIAQSWQALRRNQLRSVLTMLGIVWGLASVVILLAYGQGLGGSVLHAFMNMGNNVIVLWPGQTSLQAGGQRAGKPVTFKVDAFPKDTFQGVVSQVRMNPTTVQSVVTYDTIIEFANPELKLFPGMTAYVTIPVATAQNVLKLPNTALRYKPPMAAEEVLALYKRYGIDEGAGQSAGVDSAAPGGI